VELFKRKGNLVSLHPAQILVIGFGSLILWGTLLFMLPIATFEKGRGLSFIDALFETISAFATVGLSANYTPDLSPFGRILITIMMFIGRLGPLTMAFALLNTKKEAKVRYAEEKILIG
jgi:Trk-type K+ transport system membrane component